MSVDVNQVIETTMSKIRAMGGETTFLITGQDIIPIEEALNEYRPDLISAFNQPIVYSDAELDLDDNMRSFLQINLYDLKILTRTHMPDCSTQNYNIRSAERNPRSFGKISKLMNTIYRAVLTIESAEY